MPEYGPTLVVDWGKIIVIALILGTLTILSLTHNAEGVPVEMVFVAVLGYLMGNGRVAWNTRRQHNQGLAARRHGDPPPQD